MLDGVKLHWSGFEPSHRSGNLGNTTRSIEKLATAFPNIRSLRRTSKGISLPKEGEPPDHVRLLFIDLGDADEVHDLV